MDEPATSVCYEISVRGLLEPRAPTDAIRAALPAGSIARAVRPAWASEGFMSGFLPV
jgi:hypothetical protein